MRNSTYIRGRLSVCFVFGVVCPGQWRSRAVVCKAFCFRIRKVIEATYIHSDFSNANKKWKHITNQILRNLIAKSTRYISKAIQFWQFIWHTSQSPQNLYKTNNLTPWNKKSFGPQENWVPQLSPPAASDCRATGVWKTPSRNFLLQDPLHGLHLPPHAANSLAFPTLSEWLRIFNFLNFPAS